MESSGRRPDFVVIGAMKAGTTTLFQWLDGHPGCHLPAVKEPHFFSRDEEYAAGPGGYLALFADAPDGWLTGEASASYADPRVAAVVAGRMRELAPDVRLVYLVREPVARLKSHYLHEWQRSRERRPLLEALADPDNAYAAMSRYVDAVTPFLEVFGADRVLVLGTEELASADGPGWARVTDHLGLAPLAGRSDRANVSAGKMAFNPVLLRLWESGVLDHVRRLPAPVRRAGRRLTGRATRRLHDQGEAVAATPLPPDLVDELTRQWHEVRLLGVR